MFCKGPLRTYNARAKQLYCSLNLLFVGVLASIVSMVCQSLLKASKEKLNGEGVDL